MASNMIHYVISKRVAEPCKKSDLELYTWDVIMAYIDNCVQICAEEIEKWKTGKERVNSEQYYVTV